MNDELLESTSRQYGEATQCPEAGQSTLLSCEHCGRIYYNITDLSNHISETHIITTGPIQDITSVRNHEMEPENGEERDNEVITLEENVVNESDDHEESLLYFVKHENILWPALGNSSKGSPKEVIKLTLLDEASTHVTVACSHVKEFTPYTRVPMKRSQQWKAAYAEALKLYENKS